jgi:acetyl esterase/lipase
MNTDNLARLILTALFWLGFTAQAQQAIPLWPDGAPGALGKEPKDIPTLTPFLPQSKGGVAAAMLICPGGGYENLTAREGNDYAWWFNTNGIAGFVLKYRVRGRNGYRYPAPFLDVTRAIRLIRARAAEWHIDPHRVGVIGSSAGGHLASTLLTHFDAGKPDAADPIERQSSRPDLGILCYAVITMGPDTNPGTHNNLLGKHADPALEKLLSNELQVTPQTPPCFIWHTWEDKVVKVENSLMFAEALRRNGVPFDLHIYQKGPHAIALGSREFDPSRWHPWLKDLAFWLKAQGFIR